ncbi:PREDICTED: uncharacterized protein LOC108620253 [Drosophila arizonae]|uniref:Uncharacterized protein LOC108620253 n=1 Tax=Drosophila arizonae TaxID=7263 RepID=A0ABM1PZL6_DROAR|nr:PREDICTED: uncharacterized protein LOC108620253 [Drosophila arizonae]
MYPNVSATVCVMVTVPTAQQEAAQQQSLHNKHFADKFNDIECSCACHNWSSVYCGQCRQRAERGRSLELPDVDRTAPMEKVLRQIISQLRLEHVFWSHDLSGGQLQVRFDLKQDERYERLLYTLREWGIGDRPGTHVTAFNCLDTRVPLGAAAKSRDYGSAGAAGAMVASGTGDAYDDEPNESQRMGWQSFVDSVRCRLNVNQVVRMVRRDATVNFDFVVLLMVAALLSCVGLVENSFLYLSSSMLISPLMGPIIAAIFGSVINDRGLRWLGIKNELIGIGISVGTGFLFGSAVCLCGLSRFFMLSAGFTEEIISRCDTHSLAIGLCTALVSGAAAAIGVLGGNTGSLVGVAISASLLPPAVNAGLLWAIALCTRLFHIDPDLLQNLSKHRDYSAQLHVELFVCATVSMALTLVNVVCVWLMGVVVLRIKEVAPAVQRDQQFWRHDVRLAREVALNDPELHSAIDRLDLDERRQVNLDAAHYQHTWSPGTVVRPRTRPDTAGSCQGKESNRNYHTVHGFQNFCMTLHKRSSEQPRRSSEQPRRSSSVLPSFLDVFKPLEPAERSSAPITVTVHKPPPPPPESETETEPEPETETIPVPAAGSGATTNYRSLPDLRVSCPASEEQCAQELSDPEPHTKSKISRSVHWNVERRSLNDSPDSCSLPSSSQDSQRRYSVQMLVPPPPDRRLRLLERRQPEDSEESEYKHEFNV